MGIDSSLDTNRPIQVTDARWNVVSSFYCMNGPQPEGHMANYIRRRKFLATLLGGAAVAWSLAARAQQLALPVVGFLDQRSPDTGEDFLRPFRQGLKDT